MLSPKTKHNLLRILPFGLIWLFSGWIFLFVEYATLGGTEGLPSTAIQMDFPIFIFASLAVMGGGLLVGAIELMYLEHLFAKMSFTRKILYKFFIYTLIFSLIILVSFPVAASLELDTGVFDPRVWDRYYRFLTSITHLSTGVQLTVSLSASLFYAEISESIGHGVLINFFTGKYHAPVEEERIFI